MFLASQTWPRGGRVLLSVMAMLLLPARDAAGQRSAMPADGSLPPALVAQFEGAHALVMDVTSSASVEVSLLATFVNKAPPYSVGMRWAASQDIDGQVVAAYAVVVNESTSFMPTAVCRAAANGTVLFVAGWYGRTKSCVVEKWTLGPGKFRVTVDPSGERSAVFTPSVVAREAIYLSSTGPAAIESMAFHPVSCHLVLLEEGPEANLHLLDMAGTLVEIADATRLPQLGVMKHLRMGAHQLLPYGVFLVSERAWSHRYASNFLVIPDRDGDGTLEVANARDLDQASIAAAFPSRGWIEVE